MKTKANNTKQPINTDTWMRPLCAAFNAALTDPKVPIDELHTLVRSQCKVVRLVWGVENEW